MPYGIANQLNNWTTKRLLGLIIKNKMLVIKYARPISLQENIFKNFDSFDFSIDSQSPLFISEQILSTTTLCCPKNFWHIRSEVIRPKMLNITFAVSIISL